MTTETQPPQDNTSTDREKWAALFDLLERFKRENPWYEPAIQAIRDWHKANAPMQHYEIVTLPTTSWIICPHCKGTGWIRSGRITSGYECCPVCSGARGRVESQT
jgi:excinuclease UvrABC ATPase subunit